MVGFSEGRAAIVNALRVPAAWHAWPQNLKKRGGQTSNTTIRLHRQDIELAKDQAEKLGPKYQNYLESVFQKALRRDKSRQASG